MDVYVFQAALYCEDCGQRLEDELAARGTEDTGDSDDFPQGPCPDGGGEADAPQHCDNGPDCINAEPGDGGAVGALLENPLTHEGQGYVEAAVTERPGSVVVRRWADFYGIGRPGTADNDASKRGGTRDFPGLNETHIETWFERDRAHVALYDSRSGAILGEWWDDQVGQAIEDGFLDPRNYHGSAYEWVRQTSGPGSEET